MILNEIKDKLLEIDPNVYYGKVDDAIRESRWDYIVFDRRRIRPNDNRTSVCCYYSVHIVRENFVPEGLDKVVIDKMCEIAGMRLSNADLTFNYVAKPNTNETVEMLSIEFVKAIKV